MLLNKIKNLEEYADFLENNLKETDQLYQELLIHVTEFFRNPESFQALKIHVFPKIFARKSKDVAVRMWVPGCSTGEEVYSLAMCLLEFMDETKQYCPVQIFGTDLSEEILIKARRGKYPEDIKAHVSPERLERFFTFDKQEGTYTISKSIRSFCIFAKHNFVRDTPFSNLDLVSCRNVLIYLDSVLQQRVFPVFHFSLNPGGFLFLGSSESATKFEEFFGVVDRDNKIYKRKLATGLKPLNFHYSQGNITEAKANIAERLRSNKMPEIDISKKVDDIILSKYAPATVVLNEDYSILQYRGNLEKFLSHPTGNATHHIVKTARKEILPALLDSLLNAKNKKHAVRKDSIIINFHKDKYFVTIDVTPVTLSSGVGFVVIFTDVPRYAVKDRASSDGESKSDFEVRMLQEELLSTTENLHAVIETQEAANEELRVSNEETMSANEELQSINEELETMKEELESSNEELITLNEEVGTRNDELSRLDEAKRALIKTVESKDQFISILAHELRNPLTPILHSIEVLKLERARDKELLRTLGVIERQSNNISLILKSLLDTSRAMQGKITLQKTSVDPKKLIQNAIETVTPLILAASHTIEVEWLAAEPRIEGDALRLEQVFVNLLSNAIKYTPDHGKIWVSVSKTKESLDVSIKDNGIGIATETQSKIFNLFMQANQDNTRIKGGLGVGLMLSRLLVELHKGTLTVKSKGEGHGSEFIVRLPLLGDNKAGHLPVRVHQYEVTRHKGKRVLVIDDHILLADTFMKLLTALNQEVRVAYDAQTALEQAMDFIPEVVFMDLSMPVVDGFQLVKQLKNIPTLKETYFIALSGLGDKPTIAKALESGFDKHLMKPVSAEEIMKAIEGAEGAKKQHQS